MRKETDILFAVESGRVRLYRLETSGDLRAIELGLWAFIEKMFAVGGLEDWELLFVGLSPDHPAVLEQVAAIRRCFPELDIEAFLARTPEA